MRNQKKISFLLVLLLSGVPLQAGVDWMRKVAKDHAKKCLKVGKSYIVVLPFTYENGRVSSGSAMLSEQLGSNLATIKGIRVMDRAIVRKKMNENLLRVTGPDQDTVKKLGAMLEAEVIVFGKIIDKEKDQSEVTTKLFRVDSGDEISTGRVMVKRTWTDEPRFPRGFGQE